MNHYDVNAQMFGCTENILNFAINVKSPMIYCDMISVVGAITEIKSVLELRTHAELHTLYKAFLIARPHGTQPNTRGQLCLEDFFNQKKKQQGVTLFSVSSGCD